MQCVNILLHTDIEKKETKNDTYICICKYILFNLSLQSQVN